MNSLARISHHHSTTATLCARAFADKIEGDGLTTLLGTLWPGDKYVDLVGKYLGLHDHLLLASLNGELALGISRYQPGASTGDDSYAHNGEEAGLVLSGRLELTIEDRVHLLEAGDSFSFKSHRQHRYANPSEHEDTLVVWANTPITLRK